MLLDVEDKDEQWSWISAGDEAPTLAQPAQSPGFNLKGNKKTKKKYEPKLGMG